MVVMGQSRGQWSCCGGFSDWQAVIGWGRMAVGSYLQFLTRVTDSQIVSRCEWCVCPAIDWRPDQSVFPTFHLLWELEIGTSGASDTSGYKANKMMDGWIIAMQLFTILNSTFYRSIHPFIFLTHLYTFSGSVGANLHRVTVGNAPWTRHIFINFTIKSLHDWGGSAASFEGVRVRDKPMEWMDGRISQFSMGSNCFSMGTRWSASAGKAQV